LNEPLDSITLIDKTNYHIEPELSVDEIIPQSPFFSNAYIYFNDSIINGTIYELSIIDTITDCVGNILSLNSNVRFAIPELAAYNDIVINEILFNPMDYIVRGNDFVEIYNRSEKVIDMKELVLSSINPESLIKSSVIISNDSYLLFPGDYLVLSKDPSTVMLQYLIKNNNNFLNIPGFPSYNNDKGIAELTLTDGTLIDRLEYNEDMHFDLLNSFDGVSLERISYDRKGSEETNWHSASEASGLATPGYQNSVFSQFKGGSASLEIYPKLFSPDNAYVNNLLNICYKIDDPGYMGNIYILNSDGRLVNHLKNNELLGTRGCFTWDGVTESGHRASVGIYIILFETFNQNGDVKRIKEVCVLGGKH
jgi:hypothetical protein